MDILEGAGQHYHKVDVDLDCYDGRKIQGSIYSHKEVKAEGIPSKRYLGLIIDGAREQNLDAAYIENLAKHPTYSTP